MKKTIIFLLRVGVSAGILYFIFTHTVSLEKVSSHLRGIKRGYLLFAGLGYGVVLLLGIIRWKVLLKAHKIQVPVLKAAKLSFIGFFFNNFLPSMTGGDIVKAYYVSKETKKRAEAVSTVVVDRICGLFALFLLGSIAAVTRLGTSEIRKPVLATLGFFLIAIIFFIALVFSRRLHRKIVSFDNSSAKKGRIADILKKTYFAFHYYRNCPGALMVAFALSLLLQMIVILINYGIALGLGVKNIELSNFFIFIPLASVISAIPVTLGGWGLREKAYEKFLSFAGISGDISVSISIMLGLIALTWSLIGLPLYLLHRLPKQERGLLDAKGI